MSDITNSNPLSADEVAERDSLLSEASDTRGERFQGDWHQHYWSNEAKQARLHELTAKELGEVADEGPWPLAKPQAEAVPERAEEPSEDTGHLDPLEAQEVAAHAERTGLSEEQVGAAFEAGSAFWRGLTEITGEQNVDDIELAYDTLPEPAQLAVDRELGLGVPAYEPASDDELQAFSKTEAGKILAPYWGEHAAGYLGLALARWERMVGDLSDEDYGSLDYLIRQGMSAQERAYVIWALAG